MKSILTKFIGFNVLVAKIDGKGVYGELIEVDQFGLTILTHIESDHEIKEKAVVYIMHKNIEMVSAREDENIKSKDLISYDDLFNASNK